MRDFTLDSYSALLISLKKSGYTFLPFSDYLHSNSGKQNGKQSYCIFRHDVDRLPSNSLITAKMENMLGIRGSYYFRIVPQSFDVDIIKQIAGLGHEVGYHYEDVDLVLRRNKLKVKSEKDKEDLIDLAFASFSSNLERMRQVTEIKTICMHGSPRGKYDNKIMWAKYNYKDLGLIGEPYYDLDYNAFAYFTDTGRKWNGGDSSVRDKVDSKFKFNFEYTKEIISNVSFFPDKLLFTIHPQRWNDKLVPWLNEYVSQNVKNKIKKHFFVKENLLKR